MKKLILLGAAFLAMQAVPAFADSHESGKHNRGDKMFEMVDTNKDGMISAEESATSAKKRFDMMDANKDGNITKDEAKAHHEAKKAKWQEMKAKKDAAKALDKPAETAPPVAE